MPRKKAAEIVAELAAPILEELNFELVDTEFVKEGPNWYLRVYIDKPGGITIDDCQAVSERLEVKLDEVDPIPHSYILEVSSPGLDRPLKKESDFVRYKGEPVELTFYKPENGRKKVEGKLEGLIDNKIVIVDENGQRHEYDRQKVSLVKRTIVF